jgi:hypothetical protein
LGLAGIANRARISVIANHAVGQGLRWIVNAALPRMTNLSAVTNVTVIASAVIHHVSDQIGVFIAAIKSAANVII